MTTRAHLIIFSLALAITFGSGCSGSDSASEASKSSAAATGPARWIAFCEASYDSGAGNATSSDRASWVQDCASECAMPEWEQSCVDQAEALGINVGS
jgi:hypothetical protein